MPVTAWPPCCSVQPTLHPLASNLPNWGCAVPAVKRTVGEPACTSPFPVSVLVLILNKFKKKKKRFGSDTKSGESKKCKFSQLQRSDLFLQSA